MNAKQTELIQRIEKTFEAANVAVSNTMIDIVYAEAKAEREAERAESKAAELFIEMVAEQAPKDAEALTDALRPYFYAILVDSRYIGCKKMLSICKATTEYSVIQFYYSLNTKEGTYKLSQADGSGSIEAKNVSELLNKPSFQQRLKRYILDNED